MREDYWRMLPRLNPPALDERPRDCKGGVSELLKFEPTWPLQQVFPFTAMEILYIEFYIYKVQFNLEKVM